MKDQFLCDAITQMLILKQEDLSGTERAALATHLMHCSACQAAQKNYDRLIAQIHELPSFATNALLDLRDQSSLGKDAEDVKKQQKLLPSRTPFQSKRVIFNFARVIENALSGLSVAIIILASVILFRSGPSTTVGSYPIGQINTTQQASGYTPSFMPSPTPTFTPSPAQTITAGTLICKSDKSTNWAGWQIGGAWKLLNGELLYDGSGNGAQLVAPASCQPTVANYAVDVKMRIVSGCCHFGIIVRGNASTNGYTGYQVSIYTTTYENLNISTLGGQGGATAGYGFDNNFHDWRAEVKDNVINFVIDGSKVLSLTDNTYLSPGEVSICCTDTMQLDITSFQVMAL